LVALSAITAPAGAQAAVGGLGAAGEVTIADVACVVRCVDTHKATPGAKVRLRGLAMDRTAEVVFRGADGPIRVAPLRSTEVAATVRVPRGARSSRPYVIDSGGSRSSRAPHTLYVLPRSAIPAASFPVKGSHSYWDGFGAGRGHQGVDVGASCGTELVAALPGTVSRRSYQGAAGNYVVIDVEGIDVDIAYMHLARPAHVRPGQTVSAGQSVGFVGETGRASGCHLHFEYWSGRFWGGGTPVDPMPFLREWDRPGH
jgi:murein DD-endopeptidase MepM/ murein hydrolase activator NlpD